MSKQHYKIQILVALLMLILANKSTESENHAGLTGGSKSRTTEQTETISYTRLTGSFLFPENLVQPNNFTTTMDYSSPFEDKQNIRIGVSIPLKRYGTTGFNYL